MLLNLRHEPKRTALGPNCKGHFIEHFLRIWNVHHGSDWMSQVTIGDVLRQTDDFNLPAVLNRSESHSLSNGIDIGKIPARHRLTDNRNLGRVLIVLREE